MKTGKVLPFLKGTFATTLVGLTTFIGAPANAAHEAIYVVDSDNNLALFYSDAPGTIVSQYAISGIKQAEEIRGIDYWDGTIYGFGSFGYLYAISEFGQATQVGPQFSVLPNGATFGVDNDGLGFRIVSNLGQNLLVDRTTGAVTQFPNVAQRVDAVAYDGALGNWYAADTLNDVLETLNPSTGGVGPIGVLGIDASRYNGFDISPFTGIAYLGTPAASSDPQANLYTVDLSTGFASLVGQISSPFEGYLIRALTVVPEPSSVALLVLGSFGLFLARRRQ